MNSNVNCQILDSKLINLCFDLIGWNLFYHKMIKCALMYFRITEVIANKIRKTIGFFVDNLGFWVKRESC